MTLIKDMPIWDELHPTLNGDISLMAGLSHGSNKVVWWQCDKGHEWQAKIGNRTILNRGCPYCSGRKILQGFNDLATVNPKLIPRWDEKKNLPITIDMVGVGTHGKYWWLCSKGHSWESVISHMASEKTTQSKSNGCPYCSGRKVLQGFNDLATVAPEIARQWHSTLNADLKPSMVTAGNNTKVWWECDKGHAYQAKVGNRFYLNRSCPYCAGQKVLAGENDFASNHPELISQWHPTKNNSLKPNEITPGTDKKIWWQCSKGHEWDTSVHHRTGSKKTGCPSCAGIVSKAELELIDFVTSLLQGSDVQKNVRSVINGELDIYIPEKQMAIEYNGLYWHSEANGKDKTYQYNKWFSCKEQGIQLIQIWEDDYIRNSELVKNMLAYKLGASRQETVYARRTEVKTLTKKQSDEFLNNNHIQGDVDGKMRVALMHDNIPVAVMVLKTEAGSNGKILNLLRYATSMNVVGGFTKLLSWVEKNNPNITSIVTFSDNTVSDGGLYANNGFKVAGIVKPDYMYLVKGVREHKFNYRLKRFKTDPNLKWVEGLSETQLAELNNLPRIWDAGKVKWVKSFKSTR